MKFRHVLAALLLALPLPAIAQEAAPSVAARQAESDWAFEDSDIPVDPAFRFGKLANGMRYVIRQNATPEGTGLVRLWIGSGSLSEREDERGLAHFLEHMAFNGSTRVPEGEMIKLLEREGLAFGADTNASTGFDQTLYKLDLPRNDPALLDTALMLMRETASELTIAEDAVNRERGVILAERRDRTTYSLKETMDRFAFLTPEARYVERLPIGVAEVLENAPAASLRGFYEREYVPENAVLVVVGDFDPALVEAGIRKHFASWRGAPDPAEPDPGPVDFSRSGAIDIYIDPALSERVQISAHGPWQDEPDSIANRQRKLLRGIGYAIVNRRLQTLAREEDPPFRGAGFGTADTFEESRTTNLIVDSPDGQWREGLLAATKIMREALAYGFSEAEVTEQVARIRSAQENAVGVADTRSHGSLASDALELVTDRTVPSTPQSSLERFEALAPMITPQSVLAALREDAVPLDDPLIRFRGRLAPEGGEEELRSAWQEAQDALIAPPDQVDAAAWAYTDFGPPGLVAMDVTDSRLGIRMVRFANGVMLNLKPTELQHDRVRFELNLDGGNLLNTRDEPLRTAMVRMLPAGGLGAHTQDELQSVLAGRNVTFSLTNNADTFGMAGTTTPRDLELQLQLLAAALTDPAYRTQGETRFRRDMANFFKSAGSTPNRALSDALGRILSDGDPRFSLQPEEAYQSLSFAKLREDVGDRLQNGAIELALVGDFEPEAAIAMVARTLGALLPREPYFQPREEARRRGFTADRSPHLVTHRGEPDQALLRWTWPIGDDSDQVEKVHLQVLERIVRLVLQEELRERLGKAYSPSASSQPSRTYRDYGTFSLAASVDVGDIEETRDVLLAALGKLRRETVSTDMLDRARQPLLEGYDNALKTNGGWMGLVDRAQSESYRLERFLGARKLYEGVTPGDIRAAAERYLAPEDAVEITVLPEATAENGG
jgi:zinc protease